MSNSKQIFLQLIRKPFKSLLLVIIFFTIGTFIGSTYLIYKTTVKTEDVIKENLPAYAIIKYSDYNDYNISELEQLDIQNSLLNIYEQLSKETYVKNSNIHLNMQLNQVGYFKSPIKEIDFTWYVEKFYDSIYISGIKNNSLLFEDNLIEIIEGRTFNENDKNVLIISDVYTHKNGSKIEIGDKLPLSYIYWLYGETYFEDDKLITNYIDLNEIEFEEFEVIGIYKLNKDKVTNIWENITNKYILMPYNTFSTIKHNIMNSNYQTLNEYHAELFAFENIIFKLNQPENLTEFKERFLKITKSNPQYEMYTSVDGYYQVKGVLDNMSDISILIIFIAIFTGIFISILVIYLYLKDRKIEIGILMAMGNEKNNIILKIVCEIILLGMIGLSLSIISSKIIGNNICDEIIDKQIHTLEINDLNQINYIEEIEKNYTIEIDINYILIMYIGSCSIIILSTILPIYTLLKIKPKDILT